MSVARPAHASRVAAPRHLQVLGFAPAPVNDARRLRALLGVPAPRP